MPNHITFRVWYATGMVHIKHSSFSFLIFAHMFVLLIHLSIHSASIHQAADPVFITWGRGHLSMPAFMALMVWWGTQVVTVSHDVMKTLYF